MADTLLRVQNLSVSIAKKQVLDGIDLSVGAGETHVLMGPNGAGKSTLGYTLMGHPRYTVTGGTILFDGEDITALGGQNQIEGTVSAVLFRNEE
ncbi:MAG: ATP-binding cassette domain-containing protein, partial [Treponemataceae bacterium]|nr:ATP-binding cassette domain-containing protein [Treponemataceae bacterium]